MRIGIFGGSFDPVHVGHLWIAEAALESLNLDQILWIPAATSPLKSSGTVATASDRLEMVRLAVSGAQQHIVDDREIRRGEVSYTVDTLTELQAEFPEDELYLVVGSDSLASFPCWHEPARILELATLSVVQRGGEPAIDFSVLSGFASSDRIERFKQSIVTMPIIELSSTELRERVADGRSIRFRVPHPVAALIEARGLYRR